MDVYELYLTDDELMSALYFAYKTDQELNLPYDGDVTNYFRHIALPEAVHLAADDPFVVLVRDLQLAQNEVSSRHAAEMNELRAARKELPKSDPIWERHKREWAVSPENWAEVVRRGTASLGDEYAELFVPGSRIGRMRLKKRCKRWPPAMLRDDEREAILVPEDRTEEVLQEWGPGLWLLDAHDGRGRPLGLFEVVPPRLGDEAVLAAADSSEPRIFKMRSRRGVFSNQAFAQNWNEVRLGLRTRPVLLESPPSTEAGYP